MPLWHFMLKHFLNMSWARCWLVCFRDVPDLALSRTYVYLVVQLSTQWLTRGVLLLLVSKNYTYTLLVEMMAPQSAQPF